MLCVFYNSFYVNFVKNCKVLYVCKISEIIFIIEKKYFLFEYCYIINIYVFCNCVILLVFFILILNVC